MYCAVLNQIRMAGLWRTNVSTTSAVAPAISIGHGWPNTATDAMNGMNPTEVLAPPKGVRKKNESLTMPRMANAAHPFQNLEGKGPATCHGSVARRRMAATVTAPT